MNAGREIEILLLESPDEAMLGAVEILLVRLYESMTEQGLMIPLAPEGPGKWRQSIASGLGRLGALVIARDRSNGRVVGFAQGLLRRMPEHLAGKWVGFIPHVYVLPEYRNEKCGGRMVDLMMGWFRKQGVGSAELQVLVKNAGAIRFWEARGFEAELIQMRHPF